MVQRNKAIQDLMDGITGLFESNFEECGCDGEAASERTMRDLKEVIEKFGLKVEFVESVKGN